MIKTNKLHETAIVYNASQPDLEAGSRFLVPITNPEVDLTAIMRRVWELANAAGARVQFLGLCDDAKQELSFRRALTTMSAMVNYGKVSAESEIISGKDWVAGVRSRIQEGDTVICTYGQSTKLLSVDLGVPVYVIPALHIKDKPKPNWLPQVAAWVGFITIIAIFIFIQVEIDHFIKGWATIMQVLSVIGEFGLLWFWNSLFG